MSDQIRAAAQRFTVPLPLSILMDHLRWISALLVMVGHIRQLYFVDYADVDQANLGWALFYGLSRLSHQAVLIFFLVSGAVIAGRFAHRSAWASFDLLSFTVARLTRLWLVLLPVLLLCVALIALTPARLLPEGCTLDLATVLGNAFFLQEISVPAICNNVPLWSLANEFWYYAITGAAVFSVSPHNATARGMAAAFVGLVLVFLLANDAWSEKNVIAYFPIWLLGAAVFARRLPAPSVALGVTVFVAAFVIVRIPSLPVSFYARDLIFALAAFLLLLSARDVAPATVFARLMTRTSGIAKTLAAQSYSLYLVHYPVALAFGMVVLSTYEDGRQQPGFHRLGLMLAIMAASYAAAFISYALLESRTQDCRTYILQKIGGAAKTSRGQI